MKLKTCKQCKCRFTPVLRLQYVCSPLCGLEYARGKRVREEAKVDRIQTKARKEALETIPQLIAAAQKEFNAYRRLSDKLAGHPCISCGRPLDWGTEGGSHQVDCGHYRSTGSAPHLRFDEDNAHAQCVNCNRYGAGRAVDYRIGLIQRIGLARVERLESANQVVKWDRDTLRQIKTIYRAKTRELRKNQS